MDVSAAVLMGTIHRI